MPRQNDTERRDTSSTLVQASQVGHRPNPGGRKRTGSSQLSIPSASSGARPPPSRSDQRETQGPLSRPGLSVLGFAWRLLGLFGGLACNSPEPQIDNRGLAPEEWLYHCLLVDPCCQSAGGRVNSSSPRALRIRHLPSLPARVDGPRRTRLTDSLHRSHQAKRQRNKKNNTKTSNNKKTGRVSRPRWPLSLAAQVVAHRFRTEVLGSGWFGSRS